MPSLHLDSVSFSYTSAHTVLADVTLHLGPGWTGVVGPNGSGKTTLLALAAGLLEPSTGTVTRDAGVVALVAQTVERPAVDVGVLAADQTPAAYALRGRLRLDPGDLDRWTSLSPGERKRWQVGAALWRRPDLLLVDEPTNHLDVEALDLLVAELERFGGVGLVVSHDRDLLDRLTTRTVRVEAGRADIWGGGYTAASAEWEAVAAGRVEVEDRVRRRLTAEDRRLSDRQRDLEQRAARQRRTLQGAEAKDHDTHSTAKKSRARQGQATESRRLQVLRSSRDRLAEEAASFERSRSLNGSVAFAGETARRPLLVALDGPLRAGPTTLAEVDVAVERHTRAHLRGPNGAGKSTLLDRLASEWDLPAGRLLHLRQELTDDQIADLVDRLHALPPDDRGRVLQLVARLGTDPDTLLATDRPSPGEGRKLALAIGLATEAWLLLLDEPTNHLDLATVERLEAALVAYPGALVVVSHDRRFAGAVTDTTWTLEDGRITSM